MTWTLKNNSAATRRLEKVGNVNLDTHEGRKVIGYNYFDYISEPSEVFYDRDDEE